MNKSEVILAAANDPIFSDREIGGWCFWDETGASFLGPYPTEEIARQKLKEYGEYLSTGKSSSAALHRDA
jgi:hypothetical protein